MSTYEDDGYELLYGGGYCSDPDEVETDPVKMQMDCEDLLIRASFMDESPLQNSMMECLAKIHRRLTGPKCPDCGNVDGHYYDCIQAEKCQCGARTDLPPVEHRNQCPLDPTTTTTTTTRTKHQLKRGATKVISHKSPRPSPSQTELKPPAFTLENFPAL